MQIPANHQTLSIVCQVGIHVLYIIFSMIISLHSQAFTFECEGNLDDFQPFRPMRDLGMQWSHAFSLVCEVVLKAGSHGGPET
jgi:hypothetical protein